MSGAGSLRLCLGRFQRPEGLCSRLWAAAGFFLYLAGPEEEAEEFPLGVPHESEDVAGAERFGGFAGVGFDAPAEILAAPGGEAVATGGVPDEFECAEHLSKRIAAAQVKRKPSYPSSPESGDLGHPADIVSGKGSEQKTL